MRQPSSSSYTPAAKDRGNASGGTTTVERLSKGVHNVTFVGLVRDTGYDGSQGIAFVTPLSSKPRVCRIVEWGGAPVAVLTWCTKPNGDLVDTPFVVNFLAMPNPDTVPDLGSIAYAWADDQLSGAYTPALAYNYNTTSALNTVLKIDTGGWDVEFSGLGIDQGHVQVSAHGDLAACRVVEFGNDAGDLQARVRCTEPTGGNVDTEFTAIWFRGMGLKGPDNDDAAYLLADQPSAGSYTPDADYRFSSAGQASQVTRQGVGRYQATLPGMPLGGSAQVTAFGNNQRWCVASNIRKTGLPQRVGVRCFGSDGDPVDTRFTLAYAK